MYGPDTLLLASKKPRIKELIARARTMTQLEIQSLPEKPDVIRGLLLIREFDDQQTKATVAEKIAEAMQRKHVDQPSSNTMECQVYRVASGGDNWIKSGSTLIEVKEGWHWAAMESGLIYLANSPITPSIESLQNLMSISQYIGKHTLEEFKEIERQRRNSLSPSFICQSI